MVVNQKQIEQLREVHLVIVKYATRVKYFPRPYFYAKSKMKIIIIDNIVL
jgi:hypothetical protein